VPETSYAAPVALALAGICVLAAGCSAHSSHATPTTATSTTAAPVAAAALDGLLLSAAEINAAMGTGAQLSVTGDTKQMDDLSNIVSRPECLPIFSPAEATGYANSGWTALHGQDLSDPRHKHSAVQSVVLFPSARQAAAFFTASSQSWQACSNDSFAHTMSGGREFWDVGPISNTNGVLSTVARITIEIYDHPQEGDGSTGQRALTVRNNVAIEVFTYNSTANDPAVSIAAQIAAKVPGQ
jgi:hypothetical protein